MDSPGIAWLFWGPVQSGKSRSAIALARGLGRSTLFLQGQPAGLLSLSLPGENREYHSNCILLHDGTMQPCQPITRLAEVITQARDYDVVVVDEGQFVEDLAAQVSLLKGMGKTVIVAGLMADINLKPWEAVVELIPRVENVVQCKAVCSMCRSADGIMSFRNSHLIPEALRASRVVATRSNAIYVPMCDGCYRQARAQELPRLVP